MVRAEGIYKEYPGSRIAVQGIDLHVPRGEIFGLLGPNGAGKTTTIRILTGLTKPTAGRAFVAGYNVASQAGLLHKHVGVVFEQSNLYERLSVHQNLLLFAGLHDMKPIAVQQAMQQVDIAHRANTRVAQLSKGLKQRVLIARAILHKPSVLFMDEPTTGLDPTSAQCIRNLMRDLCAQGTTIFLTTHYMEEADELCHRVAFMCQGKILVQGNPNDLKREYGQRRLRLELSDPSGIKVQHVDMDDENTPQLVAQAIQSQRLLTIHSEEATLAKVFIQLTGRELT